MRLMSAVHALPKKLDSVLIFNECIFSLLKKLYMLLKIATNFREAGFAAGAVCESDLFSQETRYFRTCAAEQSFQLFDRNVFIL